MRPGSKSRGVLGLQEDRLPFRRDRAGSPSVWKLEDAKARFSEVVRLARAIGPQRVTYRGKDAVVIVATEEFERLKPRRRKNVSLVEFLRTSGLDGIPLERERDLGRDVDL